jgi:four helix bundle protein
MAKKAYTHRDLEIYRRAFEAAMTIFELSKSFPKEERYALTDQVRRSSRSICANIAEAWRKRRYEASFINKISDAEAEAAETQVWLEFAVECAYLERGPARELYRAYNNILRTLVGMINHSETWILPDPRKRR